MKRTQDACRLGSIVCGMAFLWTIAAEMNVLPRLLASDLLRWQVLVVAGLFLWVIADRLADLHCRCCGSDDVLVRALFSSSRELLCPHCLSWNPSAAGIRSPRPVSASSPAGVSNPPVLRQAEERGATRRLGVLLRLSVPRWMIRSHPPAGN